MLLQWLEAIWAIRKHRQVRRLVQPSIGSLRFNHWSFFLVSKQQLPGVTTSTPRVEQLEHLGDSIPSQPSTSAVSAAGNLPAAQDLALPFGLRSAPYIFNSLADLFQWSLINNYFVPELLHYLDDYLTLGPPASPVCGLSLRAIQQAAVDIGIPLAPDKIEGPSTCLTFLGIEIVLSK